jgi:hypothetical protein
VGGISGTGRFGAKWKYNPILVLLKIVGVFSLLEKGVHFFIIKP